jgi:hypothetical protein
MTPEWWIYLLFGVALGYRMRDYVNNKLDPANPLVGLDWGVLAGAGIFYGMLLLKKKP